MPGLIGVSEFVDETREDYNSPTTSTFVSRMPQCRQTINGLEETLEFDREGLTKLKKAVKAIHNSGNTHVDNEMCLVRALERLGSVALSKEEPDIGAAFLKFSVVTKELSALMKTLMQNISNIVMFPVDTLLKSELRGVKGEMKRPFDKAAKDYESKYSKLEKEKKAQAKEVGMIRSEINPAEIADEMEKERRVFQLQMCEYLIKFNEIKTKKGIELLQHLVEYYHAQSNYFKDGLKTIAHFGTYIDDLSSKLQNIKQKQDEERKRLLELRTLLRSTPDFDRVENLTTEKGTGYSLHQLQGDKNHGVTRSGHLLKKSEGKVRRVWQKRRCRVTGDGFLDIFHADETKLPTRVNLLTCQIKVVSDDKKGFDLISYNRPYHFQAEDETDQKAWMSVLVNCKEKALAKAFQHTNPLMSPSLIELQKTVIRYVQNLPGNDQCCDCGSRNDVTWISLNFGVIVCIQCSGVHRDLGVHHSRIQSLTLDNLTTANLLIARAMGNSQLNEVMQATLGKIKLGADSSMEERYDFIRAKYVAKRYVMRTCSDDIDLRNDLEQAILNSDLFQLLQVWAEGADLTCCLPSSDIGETALHLAVLKEIDSTLHIVDFLIQNMPAHGLNKQTNAPTNTQRDQIGKNTALHLCAIHDKRECMKLLLRTGADFELKNSQGKTPYDVARELGHEVCLELIECAVRREKSAFDHINTDWNLPHDDGSTDFSDDETVVDERRSRSRPPSYAGGDSPVALRSRSSTCDSIQSGSSPSSSCNPSGGGGGGVMSGSGGIRQIGFPSGSSSTVTSTSISSYAGGGQIGTSPKQKSNITSVNNYGGSGSGGLSGNILSSPNSTSSSIKNLTQTPTTSSANRKSLIGKVEKRTAPAPPPTNSSTQSLYGTLPHAPRHSQNLDTNDVRAYGLSNKISSSSDIYSTLPYARNVDSGGSGNGGIGGGNKNIISNVNVHHHLHHHYDNKNYECFEPLMNAQHNSNINISNNNNTNNNFSNINITTPTTTGTSNNSLNVLTSFTHKRSPSGESIGRNIHLAGAKLVLPAGEIPTLKPVDKNLLRPKLPPPGPPSPLVSNITNSNSNSNNNNASDGRGMSNGQSNESICSLDELPIAPPRKLLNESPTRPPYGEYGDLEEEEEEINVNVNHSSGIMVSDNIVQIDGDEDDDDGDDDGEDDEDVDDNGSECSRIHHEASGRQQIKESLLTGSTAGGAASVAGSSKQQHIPTKSVHNVRRSDTISSSASTSMDHLKGKGQNVNYGKKKKKKNNNNSNNNNNNNNINDSVNINNTKGDGGKLLVPFNRCQALYNCNADNDDELAFKEGEILKVLCECPDDINWMIGEIEGDSSRNGMFPVSFVHLLPD